MKPIIFTTDEVKAILDGRKSQTRRVIKLKYSNTHLEMFTNKYGTRLVEKETPIEGVHRIKNGDGTTSHKLLAAEEREPQYKIGDVLYVRETWQRSCRIPLIKYCYQADGKPKTCNAYYTDNHWCKWKPSIHMPKEAARIFLRVTDVRAEPLQQMSIKDLKAEGFQLADHFLGSEHDQAHGSFIKLWDNLNAKRGYSYESNPWVWAISFERIEKP